MESYSIRVAQSSLAFSAAHFIAFDAGKCECLHGHNYRIAAELRGELGEHRYVYDFVLLEKLLREILGRLDHRMLLPSKGRFFRVEERGQNIRVIFGEKEWSFPREDCALLPIENTTAEELASWISGRFLEAMASSGLEPPERLLIEVEDTGGQSAIHEDRRGATPGGVRRPG